jgi:hypothetical protein
MWVSIKSVWNNQFGEVRKGGQRFDKRRLFIR